MVIQFEITNNPKTFSHASPKSLIPSCHGTRKSCQERNEGLDFSSGRKSTAAVWANEQLLRDEEKGLDGEQSSPEVPGVLELQKAFPVHPECATKPLAFKQRHSAFQEDKKRKQSLRN